MIDKDELQKALDNSTVGAAKKFRAALLAFFREIESILMQAANKINRKGPE